MDRDADRQDAAGGDDAVGHELERAVALDPQHRDLVAAGVDGDQEPAVRRDLKRALRCEPGSGPGAAGGERGSGFGGQRPVRVPVKRPDRVRPGRVVIDIDVPDHRRRIGRRRTRTRGRPPLPPRRPPPGRAAPGLASARVSKRVASLCASLAISAVRRCRCDSIFICSPFSSGEAGTGRRRTSAALFRSPLVGVRGGWGLTSSRRIN